MEFLKKLSRRPELGILISLIIVSIVFTYLSHGKFITLRNLGALLVKGAELGIMTIGIAFILISGEIDLSVGSIFGMSALFFVLLSKTTGSIPAFFIALGIACLVGFCNGIIATKTHVSSLITTLGMMMFIRGVIYFAMGGFPRSFASLDGFINALGGKLTGNFYISTVWFIVVALIFAVVLSRTSYGNWVFSVGGNKEVARAMGIKVDQVRLVNFILCALLAGLAGCISAARMHTVAATHGEFMELDAIASAVMGGCLITGGYGTIQGACIGALLVSALSSGLILSGAPAYWYKAFIGIVLVIAAIINVSVIRRAVSQ